MTWIPTILFASLATTSLALDCGDDKIRGVNIGGLFMMEPCITPGIFESANEALGLVDTIVDEYTFAQYMDLDDAAEILEEYN